MEAGKTRIASQDSARRGMDEGVGEEEGETAGSVQDTPPLGGIVERSMSQTISQSPQTEETRKRKRSAETQPQETGENSGGRGGAGGGGGEEGEPVPKKRKRGRPKGSKNKPKTGPKTGRQKTEKNTHKKGKGGSEAEEESVSELDRMLMEGKSAGTFPSRTKEEWDEFICPEELVLRRTAVRIRQMAAAKAESEPGGVVSITKTGKVRKKNRRKTEMPACETMERNGCMRTMVSQLPTTLLPPGLVQLLETRTYSGRMYKGLSKERPRSNPQNKDLSRRAGADVAANLEVVVGIADNIPENVAIQLGRTATLLRKTVASGGEVDVYECETCSYVSPKMSNLKRHQAAYNHFSAESGYSKHDLVKVRLPDKSIPHGNKRTRMVTKAFAARQAKLAGMASGNYTSVPITSVADAKAHSTVVRKQVAAAVKAIHSPLALPKGSGSSKKGSSKKGGGKKGSGKKGGGKKGGGKDKEKEKGKDKKDKKDKKKKKKKKKKQMIASAYLRTK